MVVRKLGIIILSPPTFKYILKMVIQWIYRRKYHSCFLYQSGGNTAVSTIGYARMVQQGELNAMKTSPNNQRF
jgi:hypothetical protein